MSNPIAEPPDNTAIRTALWRALHVEVDAPPHVIEDMVGLQLVDPEPNWRQRGDMHPQGTSRYRAGIVARARFVEDTVIEELARGVTQLVILGAGVDTFAQRRPDIANKLQVFEIDEPPTQAWKQQRLRELGIEVPSWLHFVPVDFELGESWPDKLDAAGLDRNKPAVIASTGVSMYLTLETNEATLRQIAAFAPGSTMIMTFLRPTELLEPEEQAGFEAAKRGAAESGTPFISMFAPDDFIALVRSAGFKSVEYVSGDILNARYFANRPDGLRTSSGEEIVLART